MDEYERMGQIYKESRIKQQLSQEALAGMMNTSQDRVSKLEHAKHDSGIDKISANVAIANELGLYFAVKIGEEEIAMGKEIEKNNAENTYTAYYNESIVIANKIIEFLNIGDKKFSDIIDIFSDRFENTLFDTWNELAPIDQFKDLPLFEIYNIPYHEILDYVNGLKNAEPDAKIDKFVKKLEEEAEKEKELIKQAEREHKVYHGTKIADLEDITRLLLFLYEQPFSYSDCYFLNASREDDKIIYDFKIEIEESEEFVSFSFSIEYSKETKRFIIAKWVWDIKEHDFTVIPALSIEDALKNSFFNGGNNRYRCDTYLYGAGKFQEYSYENLEEACKKAEKHIHCGTGEVINYFRYLDVNRLCTFIINQNVPECEPLTWKNKKNNS